MKKTLAQLAFLTAFAKLGVEPNGIVIDVPLWDVDMEQSELEKFLKAQGFKLDPACLKKRNSWYTFKGPNDMSLDVDWSSGLLRMKLFCE